MAKLSTSTNINWVQVKEQGSAPATPASGYGRIYCKSDGLYFVGDNGTEIGPLGAGGSGGALTSDDAFITGDVALNNASNWFDGPSLSLDAGTWLVTAGLSFASDNATTVFVMRLWDGTNVFAEINAGTVGSYAYTGGTISAVVVLTTTTTVKVSGHSNQTNGTMKATIADLGTTNKGCWINAVKIA
jgi:hypothetical protein